MAQYIDIKTVKSRPVQSFKLEDQPVAPRRPLRKRSSKPAIALMLIGLAAVFFGLELSPGQSNPVQAFTSPQLELKSSNSSPISNQSKPLPWALNISSIGLTAGIQSVGLTKAGNMGVPPNYTDVGWNNQGPKPGEVGTAVLDGHLSDKHGRPAVFAKLSQVKVGDIVSVVDQQSEKRFVVTATQSYDVNHAPLEKIFSSSDTAHLNLITCSGNWDKTKKDFTERRVVYTELVQ